jgi:anti-sigma regulatory factor (Ser/Thr protein kinase)
MITANTSRPALHVSNPLTLGAITTSPSTARAVAQVLLAEWGLTALEDSVLLVVSELVTNAVQISMKHPVPPPVQFAMSSTESSVLIEVRDYDPRPPVTRNPTDLDDSGRGLLLVGTLSAQWGWTEFRRGKVVWAVVR